MKDFLGNKLSVGDKVVFMQLNYRNLMKGTISKISESGKTVYIKHEKTNVCSTETKQPINQVIKIIK